MNTHRHFYQRKNLRLKNFDYSSVGLYFVTISTFSNQYLFSTIENNELELNPAGKIIDIWYKRIEERFTNIKCHEYVIMPNHFHCILEIKLVGTDQCVCPCGKQVDGNNCERVGEHGEHVFINKSEHIGSPLHTPLKTSLPTPPEKNQNISLGKIVQWFKTMTTNEYIKMVKNNILPPFNKKIWQRNYYDVIIKNEKAYHRIKNYINNNPKNWKKDSFYNK